MHSPPTDSADSTTDQLIYFSPDQPAPTQIPERKAVKFVAKPPAEAKKKKRARVEDATDEKPDSKRQHVLRDKARRHDLNDGIERLRKYVSFDLGARPTKAEIVHSAADSLAHLQAQVTQLTAYVHQLQTSSAPATGSASPQGAQTGAPLYTSVPLGPPPYSFNSSSASSTTSAAGLFFAFVLVFVLGSVSPVAEMASPVTRTLLSLEAEYVGSTALSAVCAFFSILLMLYVTKTVTTSYISLNSIKFQRAVQNMKGWAGCFADRTTARMQSNLVQQLLGRQLPSLGIVWHFCMLIEIIRFIMIRLRIGVWFERFVLWVKGVPPQVLELELSASLSWLETKSWDSHVMFLECLRAVNLMDVVRHAPGDLDLVFLKLSLYYLIGNLVGYRSKLGAPVAAWCMWCANSIADASPSDSTPRGPSGKPVASQRDHISRTSALLGAVGITAFKEFVKNGQAATKDILEGRFTSARSQFEDTLAVLESGIDVHTSPLLLRIRRGTTTITCFLNYMNRQEDASVDTLTKIFADAQKYEDNESMLTAMIMLIYCRVWKKTPLAQRHARSLVTYTKARYQIALAADSLISSTMSCAEVVLALNDGDIFPALSLLETAADFMEQNLADPRLLVAPTDFSRVSLRFVKIVAFSEDDSIRQTLPRVLDVAHRCLDALEKQGRTVKYVNIQLNYLRARLELFEASALHVDSDSVRAQAKRRFERCAALCREIGLQDWGWMLRKCEKRLVTLERASPHVDPTQVVTHRK